MASVQSMSGSSVSGQTHTPCQSACASPVSKEAVLHAPGWSFSSHRRMRHRPCVLGGTALGVSVCITLPKAFPLAHSVSTPAPRSHQQGSHANPQRGALPPAAPRRGQDLQEKKDSLSFRSSILRRPLHLPLPGKYNATNALVAACVGKLLAVEEEDILEALANIELTRNRTEWKKAANGADILSDVYNANPTAMKLILETFSAIPANEAGQKIAVLADMKELGPDSVQMHTDILKYLNPSILVQLVLYGEDIQELAEAASRLFPAGSVSYFKKNASEDQFEDMLTHVQTILQPADQILLKGSNSMNLAKVVEELEKGVSDVTPQI